MDINSVLELQLLTKIFKPNTDIHFYLKIYHQNNNSNYCRYKKFGKPEYNKKETFLQIEHTHI